MGHSKFMIGQIIILILHPAGCLLFRAWESMLIGAIGGLIPLILVPLIDKMKIDDCVGAAAVHGGSGIWGNSDMIRLVLLIYIKVYFQV